MPKYIVDFEIAVIRKRDQQKILTVSASFSLDYWGDPGEREFGQAIYNSARQVAKQEIAKNDLKKLLDDKELYTLLPNKLNCHLAQ